MSSSPRIAVEVHVTQSPSLLSDVAHRRPGAVTACVDRYGGFVYTLARRWSPTEEDARDAVQEIFLDLWTHAERFDPSRGTEAGFIALIARRRLIDRRRHAGRRPPWGEMAQPISQDARAEHLVDAAKVGAAVASLPEQAREAMTLSLVWGLSHREIADRTGDPLGTVKDRIRKGLQTIRSLLGGAA